MKLIVEETINNVVEVETLETILQITDFDAGLRQMLEAEQSNTTTATGNIVLTDSDKVIQLIDPGGISRNVTLPAESVNNHGFLFHNTADVATELLVIKNDAGTTIGTVYPGVAGWFVSNGTTWVSSGGGGSALNDLTDVATAGQADGNLLQYNSSDGLWKPVSAFPQSVVLFYDQGAMTGGTTTIINTGQPYASYGYPTTTTINNQAEYTCLLQKGTYTLKLLHLKGGSGGQVDIFLNGTEVVGDIEMYAASTTLNQLSTTAGIVVAYSGLHTITLIAASKHASSSGYTNYQTNIAMIRTGA